MTSPTVHLPEPRTVPPTGAAGAAPAAARAPAIERAGSTVVTGAPTAVSIAETVAIALAAVVLFDGPVMLAAAALILVRAVRTPQVRLVTRPLDGVDRATIDMVGVFGAVALVGGSEVAAAGPSWMAMGAVVLAARVAADLVARAVRSRVRRSRVLVVGPSAEVTPLLALLRRRPELGIDTEAVGPKAPLGPADVAHVDAVVLLDGSRPAKEVRSLVRRWRGPALFVGTQLPSGSPTTETLWTQRLHVVPPRPVDRPAWVLRSGVERTAAVVGLVVLSPLLGVVTLTVRASGPGPVLFRQERVGLDGRRFTILKFRSMPVEHRESGWNAASGAQPTAIGRFLRETSVDELPQLLNVARGDMSLIGPRPEMPHYVARFEGEVDGYADRHRVPAGLTGWAQAHGLRGDTSLADRVCFDNNYIDDWSVRRDLQVLVRTIGQLLPARWRPRPPEVDDVIDLRTGVVETAPDAAG